MVESTKRKKDSMTAFTDNETATGFVDKSELGRKQTQDGFYLESTPRSGFQG